MNNKSQLFFLLLLAVFMVACSESTTETTSMDETETTINFSFQVGDKEVKCGETYTLGSSSQDVTVQDARFYVSNVQLITDNGDTVDFALQQDGLWQWENIALLDFEDATESCIDSGTEPTNMQLIGTIPTGNYTGIQFDLGVPFEHNHVDVTTAESPLNIASMWWNWRGGYKFARIDLMTPTNPWFIHLGSVGCEASDTTVAPEKPCATPNLTTITLDNFNHQSDTIVADLTTFLADVDLSQSEPQPHGCMSKPGDPDCQEIFPAFGLNGSEQQLFRVE